jgi:hypothetical protein
VLIFKSVKTLIEHFQIIYLVYFPSFFDNVIVYIIIKKYLTKNTKNENSLFPDFDDPILGACDGVPVTGLA